MTFFGNGAIATSGLSTILIFFVAESSNIDERLTVKKSRDKSIQRGDLAKNATKALTIPKGR